MFELRCEHTDYCKSLIKSRQIDVPYLTYITQFHPNLKGRPIIDFTWNSTGGFKAVFKDGNTKTFSYKECIDGWMTEVKGAPTKNKHPEHVTKAFRNEVWDQTKAVRNRNGLTGRGKEYHVGHPWEEGNAAKDILKDFVAMKSLDLKSVEVEFKRPGPNFDFKIPYLVDTELAQSWREYHKNRATNMRMERAEDNLRSISAREPIWPFIPTR